MRQLDPDNYVDLEDYFAEQTNPEAVQLLAEIQSEDQAADLRERVLHYLRNRFDIDDNCGPNREMRIVNDITFDEDIRFWKPLYDGEKAAGLLDKEEV